MIYGGFTNAACGTRLANPLWIPNLEDAAQCPELTGETECQPPPSGWF